MQTSTQIYKESLTASLTTKAFNIITECGPNLTEKEHFHNEKDKILPSSYSSKNKVLGDFKAKISSSSSLVKQFVNPSQIHPYSVAKKIKKHLAVPAFDFFPKLICQFLPHLFSSEM